MSLFTQPKPEESTSAICSLLAQFDRLLEQQRQMLAQLQAPRRRNPFPSAEAEVRYRDSRYHGGVARAASAKRDENGRFLDERPRPSNPDNRESPPAAGVEPEAGPQMLEMHDVFAGIRYG